MSIVKKDDEGKPIVMKKATGLSSLRKQVKTAKAFDEAMSKIASETLVLCIDTSSSMTDMTSYTQTGTDAYGYPIFDPTVKIKIDVAREAAKGLVEASKRSMIGIVIFHSRADLVCEPTLNTNPALQQGLASIRSMGMTEIAGGIRVSIDSLRRAHTKLRRIILLSDGCATGDDPMIAAQEAKNLSIIIDTVAFGDNADRDTLRAIAELTGGVLKEANDAASLIKEMLMLEAGIRGLLTGGV
jgi:hypothetical protein